ncbi:alkaline phosphatase D family protein [Zhongshania sp.]|uniref:alkaline phosphatase D family protein n=1 Tax=Zhongshania sp. TaxID=1971902 RepID=UPI003565FE82
MAKSPSFSSLVAQSPFTTDGSRDHTVKIDLTGLSLETSYYCGFSALDFVSQTDRSRTLPQDGVDHLRAAALNCASIPQGFFNAYRRVAERPDLDCVIHLGDCIYEYGYANTLNRMRWWLPFQLARCWRTEYTGRAPGQANPTNYCY